MLGRWKQRVRTLEADSRKQESELSTLRQQLKQSKITHLEEQLYQCMSEVRQNVNH